MMNNEQAYNKWSETYDEVINPTRDTEAIALRGILKNIQPGHVLEVGCGTGKNTGFLLSRSEKLTGMDFSEKMLDAARRKFLDTPAVFIRHDVRQPWPFSASSFDLVTFSLMLEHIRELDVVFSEAGRVLQLNGLLYLGELHPEKQREGSKAKFMEDGCIFELECFTHESADFSEAATRHGFACLSVQDWFEEGISFPPRILTMLFRKTK